MHPDCMNGEKIRCPCDHKKCRNKGYLEEVIVKCHLAKYGFMKNYNCWYCHGETFVPNIIQATPNIDLEHESHETETINHGDFFRSMMQDVIGPSQVPNVAEEDPNLEAQHLYDMFRASEQELWEGNPGGHFQLSAVARLMNLKAEFHFSERLYDEFCKFLAEI
ncbi:uncharacterized protein LOC126653847 [Mercurialis annua]|uniref:uncharacterized protein LOC126653847 n=1 Tax=Mercurialis annua TaxID=3986 RepID=UPI002160911B|nr:uncharacterized protein LOC126653847 [Mercurialis annua]XP_050203779.1 uncharacterized protein LOC126653847 [Mercurialis annua]XP_050203780.1 uncharacterized protein LOC126653847 [Mercurialis annua]XP_050203782.1 uncharacterized protein LOC126653847 [Mercurialis annua]XP_050203786.1 uncharacterized protein LOC126653847 [Mercurialis annua]